MAQMREDEIFVGVDAWLLALGEQQVPEADECIVEAMTRTVSCTKPFGMASTDALMPACSSAGPLVTVFVEWMPTKKLEAGDITSERPEESKSAKGVKPAWLATGAPSVQRPR